MSRNWTDDQYLDYLRKGKQDHDPQGGSDAVDVESELHQDIMDYCKQRGWIALHGSMAHRAMRTPGEFDFVLLASEGRVFFIEAKSKTGKLSPEQNGLHMMAEMLGHKDKVRVVRSMLEFRDFVE